MQAVNFNAEEAPAWQFWMTLDRLELNLDPTCAGDEVGPPFTLAQVSRD